MLKQAESGPPPPQLAPPGAGLPKMELIVGRLILGWQLRRATRQSANESVDSANPSQF
jgi:hypothetical protein